MKTLLLIITTFTCMQLSIYSQQLKYTESTDKFAGLHFKQTNFLLICNESCFIIYNFIM